MDDVDRFLEDKYKGDLTEYIRAVLDRERITIIQHASPTPQPFELPAERSRWAYWFDELINLTWTRDQKDIERLDEAVEYVLNAVDEAKKNGCKGLKNALGYTRSLSITPTSYEDANRAFKNLWATRPFKFRPAMQGWTPMTQVIPRDADGQRNLRIVQDYLL